MTPAGVKFYYGSVESATHSGGQSEIRCSNGTNLVGSLVVDATGHSRKLVEYDKAFNPGKQGFCSLPCHGMNTAVA